MASTPATPRDFGRQDAPDTENRAEVALPRLPIPGPAAQGILALFDQEADAGPSPSHSIH